MTVPMKFCKLFEKHMVKCGFTRRNFGKETGVSHVHVTNILNGIRTPPLEKLEIMATVLKLTVQEKKEFFDAAYLEHAPEKVREMLEELHRTLVEQSKKIVELDGQLSEANIKLSNIEGKFLQVVAAAQKKGIHLVNMGKDTGPKS
jgi:transcriptional regulator with XRE-family HTH domain